MRFVRVSTRQARGSQSEDDHAFHGDGAREADVGLRIVVNKWGNNQPRILSPCKGAHVLILAGQGQAVLCMESASSVRAGREWDNLLPTFRPAFFLARQAGVLMHTGGCGIPSILPCSRCGGIRKRTARPVPAAQSGKLAAAISAARIDRDAVDNMGVAPASRGEARAWNQGHCERVERPLEDKGLLLAQQGSDNCTFVKEYRQ